MKNKAYLKLSILLLFVCCFVATGFADDETPIQADKLTSETLVEKLLPKLRDDGRGIEVNPIKPVKPALSITGIKFKKNSSELTNQARERLEAVGKALNDERLTEFEFMLEGHADASGSDELNMRLSRERAESVKNYLVTRFNIEPDRLKTIGKGETELLPGKPEYSPDNRRVKLINRGRR